MTANEQAVGRFTTLLQHFCLYNSIVADIAQNQYDEQYEEITMKDYRKKRQLFWIGRYCRKNLWAVGVLSLLSAVISGSFILLALVSRQILDAVTGELQDRLLFYTGELILIILLQAGLNILHANLRIRVMTKLEMNLRQKIFSLLLKKQYAKVKHIHSGEIINRFTSDIEIIVTGIISLVPQLVSMLTRLVGGMAVLFAVDVKFTCVIFLIGLLVLLCGRLYSGKFRYLHKEVQRTSGKVRSFLQECVENMAVIKSFVNESFVMRHLMEYQQENYQVRKKRTSVSNMANTAVYVVFSGGYYAALVWGAVQIAAGSMTFGTVTALLQILDQIKTPFRSMSGLLPQYYSMIASTERLMELEELPDEEIPAVAEDTGKLYHTMRSIHMEAGTFSYEEGETVFQDASFTIEKGTSAAVIGLSGAGKSTLLKLLLSLEKLQSGSLCLETTQGKKEIHAGMRGLFSYVPQGNLILSGTVRENILFGKTDVPEADMEKAAEIACIAEDIREMPKGYDTLMGERGTGLSEGQVQRIAIARALLDKAPILLLDECTSALDTDTEKRLLANLKKLEEKTIICVSHKDAAVQNCDIVICLENKKFRKIR